MRLCAFSSLGIGSPQVKHSAITDAHWPAPSVLEGLYTELHQKVLCYRHLRGQHSGGTNWDRFLIQRLKRPKLGVCIPAGIRSGIFCQFADQVRAGHEERRPHNGVDGYPRYALAHVGLSLLAPRLLLLLNGRCRHLAHESGGRRQHLPVLVWMVGRPSSLMRSSLLMSTHPR